MHQSDEYGRPGDVPPIRLSHFVHTLTAYRHVLLISMAAVATVLAVGVAVIYLLAPAERVSSLPFTLQFRGAESGQYPNGSPFTTTEIVSSPILRKVYEQNDLARYLSFPDLATALFIQETNQELQALAREYEARLANKELSTIERERLEREYTLKKESIASTQYSLNLVLPERVRTVPAVVSEKVLADTLRVWSEAAEREQGVLRFDVAIPDESFLNRAEISGDDLVVATDILYWRMTALQRVVDDLGKIPGSKVLRSSRGRTLSDLSRRLDMIRQFDVSPLVTLVTEKGLTNDREKTLRLLETRRAQADWEAREAKLRAEAYRQALALYGERRPQDIRRGDSRRSDEFGSETVMPQLSEGFLEKIVDLSSQNADREFRQDLVEKTTENSLAVIPRELSVELYDDMLQIFSRGNTNPSPDDVAQARAEMDRVFNDLVQILKEINEINELISRTVNPSTHFYRQMAPVSHATMRAVAMPNLLLGALTLFLLSIPAIVIAAMIHNRVREEEEEESKATGHSSGDRTT